MFRAEQRRFMEEVRKDISEIKALQTRILDKIMGHGDWLEQAMKLSEKEKSVSDLYEKPLPMDQDDNFAGESFDPSEDQQENINET